MHRLVEREGRQDPLHLKTEKIQGMRSLPWVERTQSIPAALGVIHQRGFELRHGRRITLAPGEQLATPVETRLDDR